MTMRIKDFKKVFWLKDVEAHRDVSWCKFPVSRRSVRFRTLMSTLAGREAYVVFLAIVSIVARERTGGVLTMNGRDMTPEDVAAELGTPKRDITKYWRMLIDIGWIEELQSSTGFEPVENRSQTVLQPVYNRSKTAPREDKRREEKTPPPPPSGEGTPRGDDGGEGSPLTAGQEAARKALVALGVRRNTARSEAAKLPDETAEAIVTEAARAARRAPDKAPEPGLIVSELRAGNASEAVQERAALNAAIVSRADELTNWARSGDENATNWLNRAGLRAGDDEGIRAAMLAQARRELLRATAGVRS